jgi:hypothetical protein
MQYGWANTGANTVTAYLLQQIQPPAHRDSDHLAPWSATGNRSAEPTFQFGYEACRSQRAPGVSWANGPGTLNSKIVPKAHLPLSTEPLFFTRLADGITRGITQSTEAGPGTSAASMIKRQWQIRWGHLHNASEHRVVENPYCRLWKHGRIPYTRIAQHARSGDCRLGIAG